MAPAGRSLHHVHDEDFLLAPNAAQTTLAATARLAGATLRLGGGSAQIGFIGVTPGLSRGPLNREGFPCGSVDAGASPA